SPAAVNGYFEEAVKRYYAYQRIDPVFTDNYFRLGFALSKLGRYAQAREEFKKYIMAFKCQDYTENTALNSQINLEDWVGHAHPDPQAYFNLANAYLMDGDYNRAVRTYEGFLRFINPGNQDIRQNYQMLLTQRKDILEKIKVMRSEQRPADLPAASASGVESSIDSH
ncbi:MAG: tetratricopeptide repeat protein, partial [Elusimicrobiota bacterium]